MATGPPKDVLSAHQQRVDRFVRDFRAARTEAPGSVRLRRKTSNSHVHRERQKARTGLRAGALRNVLSVDVEGRTADVEGMTTFYDLAEACLPHGLVPKVVPELRTLTVGGTYAGVGVESSSFRYGLVHETIADAHVLIGTGEVVRCSPDNDYRKLFFGMPNSHGTLGYVTRATVELVPSRPFVRLDKHVYRDPVAYFAAMTAACDAGEVDYVDGLIRHERHLVLILGTMVEEAPRTSNYRTQGIFHRDLEVEPVDYLTLHDYLWRWDADDFWSTRGSPLEWGWLRRLFGNCLLRSDVLSRFKKPRDILIRLHDQLLGMKREEVIQDAGIPISACAEFVEWMGREVEMWPMWVCPARSVRPAGSYPLFPMTDREYVCDIGFYGKRLIRDGELPDDHYGRLVEDEILALDGTKGLYSQNFFDEQTFWRLFDRDAYAELKRIADPDGHFPGLYEKTCARTP